MYRRLAAEISQGSTRVEQISKVASETFSTPGDCRLRRGAYPAAGMGRQIRRLIAGGAIRYPIWLQFQLSFQQNRYTVSLASAANGDQPIGGSMAIKFLQTQAASDESISFQPVERLKVYLFGAIVLFASFGMGEAVYRLLFLEFDGAKDRIPIEALFGFTFAWLATKFVGNAYRNRKERSARLNFIWARNHQIRGALEGIIPSAHPATNQQSIRVIREEVDRIEWALKKILPR